MEENTNTLRKKAEELYKQDKFEEIRALLTDEALETQKDAVLYGWRAKANYQLENYIAETMPFAEKAIIADPVYYVGYYTRALAWFCRKEYENAIKDFTKAIELNLDFADAYSYRGRAWQNLNDYDKAIADFDKAIVNYKKAIQTNPEDAELYLFMGNTRYNTADYNNAIKDFTVAIDKKPNFVDAYYSRGLSYFAIKDYSNAIKDYSKVIEFKPNYAHFYYCDRGNAWIAKEKYKEAIDDYTKAIKIKPDFENAYYYRGLAYYKGLEKKEENIDPKGSRKDFKKYLELTSEDNDIGVRYAKQYLKKLKEINDSALSEIIDLVSKIKEILLINEDCITHYTSLSAIKSLILDSNKFQLSEGNFMNDSSEGKEFFNFLGYTPLVLNKDDSVESFSPKPFIGSFVTKKRLNDLNMWRFYGKEDGIEAKGCAITIHKQKFVDDIKNSLSNEKNKEARLDDESDISFYRVVYLTHNSTDFNIPNSKRNKEFKIRMNKLKEKVTSYKEVKGANIISLEEYLNSIAFLFKRADYKNENEVRLVTNGIGFEKKFCTRDKEGKSLNTPRVFIELAPIKKIVEQVTLGPKADKANEWASALRYSYKEKEKPPKIGISHLPYK
jgi:tetratricopeptide (TPR) repeat protein